MNLGLTKTEKEVLFNKYKKEGLDSKSIHNRLDNINNRLHNLVLELNQRKKTPEYIRNKFNEEFVKLIMS